MDKKPARTTGQIDKVYSCCGDRNCENWQSVVALFEAAGLAVDFCHDGYGEYLPIKFPRSWSKDDRLDFAFGLNEHCDRDHGAMRVRCPARKSVGSKLPRRAK